MPHSSQNDSGGVQIKTPPALQKELTASMKAAGIPVPDSAERWEQALKALKVCKVSMH